MLEWVTETQGYTVTELATTTASDNELDDLLNAYLMAHPASSTREVHAGVKGRTDRISVRLKASSTTCRGLGARNCGCRSRPRPLGMATRGTQSSEAPVDKGLDRVPTASRVPFP